MGNQLEKLIRYSLNDRSLSIISTLFFVPVWKAVTLLSIHECISAFYRMLVWPNRNWFLMAILRVFGYWCKICERKRSVINPSLAKAQGDLRDIRRIECRSAYHITRSTAIMCAKAYSYFSFVSLSIGLQILSWTNCNMQNYCCRLAPTCLITTVPNIAVSEEYYCLQKRVRSDTKNHAALRVIWMRHYGSKPKKNNIKW